MIGLRSKVTRGVLSYLMLHEGQEFYVNELARKLNLDLGNLHKKLIALEAEGILESRRRGNQKHYGLNRNYPLFKEYQQIVMKTVGLEHQLREALSAIEGVEEAYLFGSYAAGAMDASSDIDLLVVGSHDVLSVNRRVAGIQKRVDREINVINLTAAEFGRGRKTDPFLKSVMGKAKVRLI